MGPTQWGRCCCGSCSGGDEKEEEAAAAAAGEGSSGDASDGAQETVYAPKAKLIGNLEEEELPPPETVLSGLDGEFRAGDKVSSHEEPEQAQPEAAGEGEKPEGGDRKEQAEPEQEHKEPEQAAAAPEAAGEGEKAEGGDGEEQEEEPEEEEEKPVIQIRTSAYDARFPSINQVFARPTTTLSSWQCSRGLLTSWVIPLPS